MTGIDRESRAVIIILLLVILVPFGALILLTNPEPYHVTSGNILREVTGATGLKIVKEVNSTTPSGGSTGGHSYTIEDKDGNLFTVYVQSFNSAESRDAAIHAYNTLVVGKGRPSGKLIVVGDQLIYIHPDSLGLSKIIVPELNKKKAGIN